MIDDVADRDAVALADTPLSRGFGTDALDAPDDLVTGDRRELAAPSRVHVTAEMVDVAVTQAGGFDPHHRAARLRVRHGEITQLPGLVAVEDDGAARLTTHGMTSSRSAFARGTARRNAAS